MTKQHTLETKLDILYGQVVDEVTMTHGFAPTSWDQLMTSASPELRTTVGILAMFTDKPQRDIWADLASYCVELPPAPSEMDTALDELVDLSNALDDAWATA